MSRYIYYWKWNSKHFSSTGGLKHTHTHTQIRVCHTLSHIIAWDNASSKCNPSDHLLLSFPPSRSYLPVLPPLCLSHSSPVLLIPSEKKRQSRKSPLHLCHTLPLSLLSLAAVSRWLPCSSSNGVEVFFLLPPTPSLQIQSLLPPIPVCFSISIPESFYCYFSPAWVFFSVCWKSTSSNILRPHVHTCHSPNATLCIQQMHNLCPDLTSEIRTKFYSTNCWNMKTETK